MRHNIGVLAWIFAMATSPALAAGPYTTQQAASHIGEAATVCGTIVSAGFLDGKGTPHFFYFDQSFPNHPFAVQVWKADLPKFGEIGKTPFGLIGRRACATGTITTYRGKPEIVATDSRQFVLK
jgi:hypothetical protein